MQVQIILFVLVSIYMASVILPIYGDEVPNQSTCDPNARDNPCSSSPLCACAAAIDGGSVCTQQMECSAVSCDVNNPCTKPGTYCITESRCNGTSLCYSSLIFDTTACPPLADSGSDSID